MDETFQSYLIRQQDGKIHSDFTSMRQDELDPGEVLIRVAYASINYKDALAATGAGKIIRRFPCVGGIDLAGVVAHSSDPAFAVGAPVLATSYEIGTAHHGGYAEYARIPAAWVVPLPAGLSLLEAMALGTAGFTAALAIDRLEHNGLVPQSGPVVVTGATGGVGSLAVDMLAKRGYEVVAITGKENEHEWLRHLGAAEARPRQALDVGSRPLEKALWAGAIDTVGGELLAALTRTLKQGAGVAVCGLVGGAAVHTTVMPFILRGNQWLGVDSAYWPMPARRRLWQRLADELRPRHLAELTQTIAFTELPGKFSDFLAGRVRGRIVVRLCEP